MESDLERLKLPISSCSLLFHKEANLEEGHARAKWKSSYIQRKRISLCLILLYLARISFNLYTLFKSGEEMDLENSVRDRRIYWQLTRQPFMILIEIIDLIANKYKIFSKFRGNIPILSSLYLCGDYLAYIDIGIIDDHFIFGNFVISRYIYIYFLSEQIIYNWIIFAISIIMGTVIMFLRLSFVIKLEDLRASVFHFILMALFMIYISRTAEIQKRREYFIFDSVKQHEKELKNIISTLPVGMVILDKKENEGHLDMKNKIKYSNMALRNILKENTEDILSPIPSMSISLRGEELESEININVNEEDQESEDLVENFISEIYTDVRYERKINKEFIYKREGGVEKTLKVESMDLVFRGKESKVLIIEDLTLVKKMIKDKLNEEFQTRLIRSISHEIRTPLNAIHGSVEILENNLDPIIVELNKTYFRAINSGIQFLLYFVDGVLKLSMSNENIPPSINLVEFNIREKLDEVLAIFQLEIEKKSELRIEVDTSYLPSAVIIQDPDIIGHIIFILVCNSLKYSYRGCIRIGVEYKAEELILRVEDEGIGIGRSEQNNLFRLYWEGGNSVLGTGIGLTICRVLVNSINGNIQLQSEIGEGTVVTITFPCQLVHEKEMINSQYTEDLITEIYHYSRLVAPSRQEEEMGEIIEKEEFKELKYIPEMIVSNSDVPLICSCAQILIVDDMSTNIVVLAGLLRLFGFSSHSAVNGLDALHKIKAAKAQRKCCANYQLILMDCNMPVMDGYTATRNIIHLISQKLINKCFVVGVTAYNSDHNTTLCYDAGMDHVLFKPVSRDILKSLFIKFNLFNINNI